VTALVRTSRALSAGAGRHQTTTAVVTSVLMLAAVTALVHLLHGFAPAQSLGALYVLAVIPVALLFGRTYALFVSLVSVVVFNFVFLPPTFELTLHGSENWFVFTVYVVSALVVSDLATRARRRAQEAEQREREAAFLAELSTTLLSGATVADELDRAGDATARLMRLPSARIVLGGEEATAGDDVAIALVTGSRRIGALLTPPGSQPLQAVSDRFLPALASVLGFALDREQLGHDALEAEALRRSDALKTALLRSVSHDLRSPLTAIKAVLESLESPALTLDEARRSDLVHTALAETIRLDRMVRNLLDLSRLEAGAARPRLRLETVDGLVERALAQIPPSSRRVDVSLPAELPLVRLDAAQVERALANLLENALKFSPPPARVSVGVEWRSNEVEIRVEDRGPGLATGEWERVFEPFRRGSSGAGGRGAGLGLAIARGFVDANGGRLWAEPAAAGGAAFVIALPAEAPSLDLAL